MNQSLYIIHQLNNWRSKIGDKNILGLPIEYQQMPEYFDAYDMSEHTDASINFKFSYFGKENGPRIYKAKIAHSITMGNF